MTDTVVDSEADALKGFLSHWTPMSTLEINGALKTYIPELKQSDIGLYPMDATWIGLDDATNGGAPAFIPSDREVEYDQDLKYSDVPVKSDYVFGTGPKGFGWYHMLTRHSWALLNQRVARMKAPRADIRSWLQGHKNEMLTREERQQLDAVSELLYYRSHQKDGLKETPYEKQVV